MEKSETVLARYPMQTLVPRGIALTQIRVDGAICFFLGRPRH